MSNSITRSRAGAAILSFAVAVGALAAGSGTAQAQSVEAFYKNKQMTMIIPSG